MTKTFLDIMSSIIALHVFKICLNCQVTSKNTTCRLIEDQKYTKMIDRSIKDKEKVTVWRPISWLISWYHHSLVRNQFSPYLFPLLLLNLFWKAFSLNLFVEY